MRDAEFAHSLTLRVVDLVPRPVSARGIEHLSHQGATCLPLPTCMAKSHRMARVRLALHRSAKAETGALLIEMMSEHTWHIQCHGLVACLFSLVPLTQPSTKPQKSDK